MRRILFSVILMIAACVCPAANPQLDQAVEELRAIRGTKDFLSKKDSLLHAVSGKADTKTLSDIYLLQVRHYTTIGTLEVKDDVKAASLQCMEYCQDKPEVVYNYYFAWSAYITYLVNHHIFGEALQEIEKMQQVSIDTKQDYGILQSYTCYGNFYSLESQYKLGAEYYEKAIAYYNQHKSALTEASPATLYGNVSGCYVKLNRPKDAEKALQTAIQIADKQSYKGNLRINLCYLYQTQNEWDKMFETLQSIEVDRTYSSATRNKVFEMYVNYYLHAGDLSQALNEALKMDEPYSYRSLAQVYQAQKNYPLALKYTHLSDSIEVASLQALQSTQLQETNQLFDHNRIFAQQMEAQHKRAKIMILSILGVALLILFLAVFYFLYRRKYERKLLSEHQKTLVALREAEQAHREAEAANQMKSNFIKNMTHELHTPLNHIMGFAQVLADEEMPQDPDSTREMAKVIEESSQHLTRLLDNVIEVSDKLSSLNRLSDVESVLEKNK